MGQGLTGEQWGHWTHLSMLLGKVKDPQSQAVFGSRRILDLKRPPRKYSDFGVVQDLSRRTGLRGIVTGSAIHHPG
jgi:hypothetical protein